jgi:hypothetical protein
MSKANEQHCFLLRWTGANFILESAGKQQGLAAKRALEEQIETILLHWGDQLLPGEPVRMLGRQAALNAVADLSGLDESGRQHIFEIKSSNPATAGSTELYQALSYLIDRSAAEADMHRELANSVWYGERTHATYLSALIGKVQVGKSRGKDVPDDARHAERLDGKLRLALETASAKSGAPVSETAMRDLAKAEMTRLYGHAHDGPLEDVAGLWDNYRRCRFGDNWSLSGRAVMWLLAPNIHPCAIEVAKQLRDVRGIDLRLVRFDVREVVAGSSWSLAVEFPMGTPWVETDRLRAALRQAVSSHNQRFAGSTRSPQCCAAATSPSSASASWRGLAGPAAIAFTGAGDRVTWAWYSDWWTEGQALQYRSKINGMKAGLPKAGIPTSFPWDPHSSDGGPAFQENLGRLLDKAWNQLVEMGAADIDEWGYYRAARAGTAGSR